MAEPTFRHARGHRSSGNYGRQAHGGRHAMKLLVCFLAPIAVSGCGSRNGLPGRPSPDSVVVPPTKIMNFNLLYKINCAGCHGAEGKGAAAIGLGDPVYLAIADDATISRVTANGVPGT